MRRYSYDLLFDNECSVIVTTVFSKDQKNVYIYIYIYIYIYCGITGHMDIFIPTTAPFLGILLNIDARKHAEIPIT